jgi:hypothetical protein
MLSEGVYFVRIKTRHRTAFIWIIAAAFLLIRPAINTADILLSGPPYRIHHSEEIKPVLRFINEQRDKNDIMYIHSASKFAFQYYASRIGLDDMNFVMGKVLYNNWPLYIHDVDELRGNKRVWFLFSHILKKKNETEESFILNHLDNIGKRLMGFKQRGASAFLYDLSNQSR